MSPIRYPCLRPFAAVGPPENDREESTVPANIVLHKFGWIRCGSGQTLGGVEGGFAREEAEIRATDGKMIAPAQNKIMR